MASYSLRKASKGILGEMLWPFLGCAASRLLFRGKRGLILMFHYIGEPVLAGVGEDLFLRREEFTESWTSCVRSCGRLIRKAS